MWNPVIMWFLAARVQNQIEVAYGLEIDHTAGHFLLLISIVS